ncbi:MAG: universal stress protein [Ignavibacteriaceae bacterium]|nr:universal stress protein [Ignavibacteriaceae bacterium]
MEKLFRKIGLAVTFSPNGKSLIRETLRIHKIYGSEVAFMHVGAKNNEAESKLRTLIDETLYPDKLAYSLNFISGEPSKAIIKKGKELNLDLLLIGALEKETPLKFYLGSVARNIMRDAPFNVLTFTKPIPNRVSFHNVIVSISYDDLGEKAVGISKMIMKSEGETKLTYVRDFSIPALASVVIDAGSTQVTENARKEFYNHEKEKMRWFTRESGIKSDDVEFAVLYGKQGWEVLNYAKEIEADLLILPMKSKRTSIFDRIFMHDVEFILEELPSNTLLIKK